MSQEVTHLCLDLIETCASALLNLYLTIKESEPFVTRHSRIAEQFGESIVHLLILSEN